MYYVTLGITGRLFRETDIFTKQVDSFGIPELLGSIQNAILENIDIGKTVAGTGGLKKFRMPDPTRGKGKRGGLRVLYLDMPDKERTYLIFLFGKDQADDLSPEQKKKLKAIVDEIKKEN